MKKWVCLIIVCISGLLSCDDELKSSDKDAIFDSLSVLKSVTENHAIPEFDSFRLDVEELVKAKNAFIASKTIEDFKSLRNTYLKAYTSFQPVAKYGFLGLANEINLYQNLNAHPLLLDGIEAFILEGKSIESVLVQNRQGFPAIDYLLNGLASEDVEILKFYTDENGAKYIQFLSKVVDRIDNLSKQAADDWNNKFKNEFTSDSAFFNIFVNSYIEYFEKRLRFSKIGVPAGKNDGIPSPEQIESVFKPEESKALLIEALESTKMLYSGINEEVPSLSKVLQDLGEDGLDAKIKLKFLEAQNVVSKLDDNLKLQVETDNTKMLETRDALQEVVKLLKLDLTSKLNVSITFQDNDGD